MNTTTYLACIASVACAASLARLVVAIKTYRLKTRANREVEEAHPAEPGLE
jgi:hypothetical protein